MRPALLLLLTTTLACTSDDEPTAPMASEVDPDPQWTEERAALLAGCSRSYEHAAAQAAHDVPTVLHTAVQRFGDDGHLVASDVTDVEASTLDAYSWVRADGLLRSYRLDADAVDWAYRYTYDDEDRLDVLAHDADGDGFDDQSWTHTWHGDSRRLASSELRSGDGTTLATWTYTWSDDPVAGTFAREGVMRQGGEIAQREHVAYDALGRRVLHETTDLRDDTYREVSWTWGDAFQLLDERVVAWEGDDVVLEEHTVSQRDADGILTGSFLERAVAPFGTAAREVWSFDTTCE
jgi:hypothetical protein